MLHDPIADFLTRIRNANAQRHRHVDIPLSKQKVEIAKLLRDQGFIRNVMVDEKKRILRVLLKYSSLGGAKHRAVINGLKRISRPGLRRYSGHQGIPRVFGGLGIAVVSTSKGIIDGESARKQKLGGELLCNIW